MAYTALYRKWRPAVFDDVKGQDPIVRTLRGQLRTGRIGHAYLLCGSRGTGKTTVARIFAKAVNCEHPVDGEPCCECESCKAIDRGASMNVTEVDAASNNNVDYVRQMLEDMQYPPTEGRYRVYIIDEVHMFSGSSFNALLKTLEEPPEYVIFILATTDPQKIPATILSRCQQYDFRRIDGATIIARLRELCAGEGIEAEDRALEYIARKAEGGMRDAISLLDQAVCGTAGALTYDAALAALGAVENELFSEYFRLTAARSAQGLLGVIDRVVMSGRDLSQFTRDFCWYLRGVLLVKTTDVNTPAVDAGDADRARLGEEAAMLSLDEIIRLIRIYSSAFNDMRGSAGKRVVLEIAAIRSVRPEADTGVEAFEARIAALERKLEGAQITAAMPATDTGFAQATAAAPATADKPARAAEGSAGAASAPKKSAAAPAPDTTASKQQPAAKARSVAAPEAPVFDAPFPEVSDIDAQVEISEMPKMPAVEGSPAEMPAPAPVVSPAPERSADASSAPAVSPASAPAPTLAPAPEPASPAPTPAPAPEPASPAPTPAPAQDGRSGGVFERWSEIYNRLDPLTKGMNKGATPYRAAGETVIYVSTQTGLDMAKRHDLVNKIKKVAAEEFGIDEPVVLKVGTPPAQAEIVEADIRAIFPDIVVEGE